MPKFHWHTELYRGNLFYGIEDSIKNYANFDGNIKACIEHGVYFGNTVFDAETNYSGFNAILTYIVM